jgi:hypothetical protein
MVCVSYQYVLSSPHGRVVTFTIMIDTMIDFGFVIAAFVPLVLLWM